MRLRNLRARIFACVAAATVASAHAMPSMSTSCCNPARANEECFRLQPQQQVRYHFKLDRPGEFNLHYHRGNEAVYALPSEAVLEQEAITSPRSRRSIA